MRSRLALRTPLLALLVVVLAGSSAAPQPEAAAAQPAMSTEIAVVMGDYWFAPAEIVVHANQPVQFISANVGAERHRLDFAAFGERWRGQETQSGESATFEISFALPGVYEMWCPYSTDGVPHRSLGMEGTLVVLDPM